MKSLSKLISLAVILSLLLTLSAGAVKVKEGVWDFYSPKTEKKQEKNVFYDNFEYHTAGEPPGGYTYITAGGDVRVENVQTPGGRKNTLKMEKESEKGQWINMVKTFSPQKKVGCEIRFKLDESFNAGEYTSFVVSLMKDEVSIADIRTNSRTGYWNFNDGTQNYSLWGGANSAKVTEMRLAPGMWYTITLIIDSVERKADFMMQCEGIKGFTEGDTAQIQYDTVKGVLVGRGFGINPAFTGSDIDKLRIHTSDVGGGKFYIDYIRISDELKPIELEVRKKEPIPAPIVADPVLRQIPDKINVLIKDEYIYYTEYPKVVNQVYMAQAERTLTALGYNVNYDRKAKKFTADNGVNFIEMTVGSTTAILNGSIVNITSPAENRNVVWFPIKEIAELLGYKVSIDDNLIMIGKE